RISVSVSVAGRAFPCRDGFHRGGSLSGGWYWCGRLRLCRWVSGELIAESASVCVIGIKGEGSRYGFPGFRKSGKYSQFCSEVDPCVGPGRGGLNGETKMIDCGRGVPVACEQESEFVMSG